jgi:hypothetical protein
MVLSPTVFGHTFGTLAYSRSATMPRAQYWTCFFRQTHHGYDAKTGTRFILTTPPIRETIPRGRNARGAYITDRLQFVMDVLGGSVESPVKLPSGRGGRAARRVHWEVVRVVTVPDDLPLLAERKARAPQTLKHIRHAHHQMARMIATGVPDAEIALITGYSPAYISRIKTDPTFEGLTTYYHEQREEIFVDVVERMRTLGLNTLDELQRRLDEEPDEWSRRELMEMAELMLVKPAAARTPMSHNPIASSGVAPVHVNVKFISPRPVAEVEVVQGLVIEHEQQ